MSAADLQRAGEAVVSAAGELARAWRAARAETWPDDFPGLADGLAEPLLVETGLALARGEDPAGAWPRLAGLLRLDPRDRPGSRRRAEEELRLLADLVERACETLPEGKAAGQALARGVLAAAEHLLATPPEAPIGVLTIWQLSALRPRGRTA